MQLASQSELKLDPLKALALINGLWRIKALLATGLILALSSFCFAGRTDSVVTINEIQYNPPGVDHLEWIEIHNQMATRVDVSGWSITGGIEYHFPENSVMEPGAYWVIASLPFNKAFQSIENVFGPFKGSLKNSGEHLVLSGRHGRIMDEIQYKDRDKWPVAPDGSGATLSKISPTYASEQPHNWSWSTGPEHGSPGSPNFPDWQESQSQFEYPSTTLTRTQARRPPIQNTLRISEISGSSESTFFIELQNIGPSTLELSDYSINGVRLEQSKLASHEFKTISVEDIGFRPMSDDPIFLTSTGDGTVDAVRFDPQPKSFDTNRRIWQNSLRNTPGEPNCIQYNSNIVINEINYHNRPTYANQDLNIAFSKSPTEWIELYNKSSQSIDLTGWRIFDAFEYEFPQSTTIEPKGFLVIHPKENGNSLSNKSECIQLLDSKGNIADIVEYFDDKPWPKDADGNGSSLELIHPDIDNSLPHAWKPSIEESKSEWAVYSYQGTPEKVRGANAPSNFQEFLVGILSKGSILIDDISVIEDPTGTPIQLIQNGDFEKDKTGEHPTHWRLLGNHKNSKIVQTENNNKALNIIATGTLEHSSNIISTTFSNGRELNPEKLYKISFRAKWLSGSPQLNTRLYFNRLPKTHILNQPSYTGTPGASNSNKVESRPRLITKVVHFPLTPKVNQNIEVKALLSDSPNKTPLVLHYLNREGWNQTQMTLDSQNSARASIPGQDEGTIIQFYIESDPEEPNSSTFPPEGIDSRALIRVGNRLGQQSEKAHTLRIILLPNEADLLHDFHTSASNHRYGATVILNDKHVWYNIGVRLRGSPFGRRGPRVGWNLKFPTTDLFRGKHETLSIDGGYCIPIGDGTGWLEIGKGVATNELIYNQIAHRLGNIPSTYDDIAFIESPKKTHDKWGQLKMSRFGDIWKNSMYEKGSEGTSFELEIIYYPSSTIDGSPEGQKTAYDKVESIQITDIGSNKETYRHNFLIKDNKAKDDYTPIITAAKALSNRSNLKNETEAILDIDNWLRVMAMQAFTTTIDSYNNRGHPHNMILYEQPKKKKLMWLPWDVDHAFFDPPDSSIYGKGNTHFAKVIQIPSNKRQYLSHLLDICENGLDPNRLKSWINHFADITNQPKTKKYFEWIISRHQFVKNEIFKAVPPIPFTITAMNTIRTNYQTDKITLSGNGWLDIHNINRFNEPLKIEWISEYEWRTEIDLLEQEAQINLTALNRNGDQVGNDSYLIARPSNQ